MAFSSTWNATYEGIPANTEQRSLGAGRIRDLKRDVRERMEVDHSWAGDDEDGKHKQITLTDAAGEPTFPAGQIGIWNDGGQLKTRVGSGAVNLVALGAEFESGTRMVFYQASAPTGWSQVAVNDYLLRVVSGAGGAGKTGGSWTITGLKCPDHKHSAGTYKWTAVGVEGGSGSGGVLSAGDIPITGQSGNNTTTLTITSDGSWRPRYTDVIICEKN